MCNRVFTVCEPCCAGSVFVQWGFMAVLPCMEIMGCCDVPSLVPFANLISCLLLWLTQNELRRCKDSSQGAVKEQLGSGVTSAEAAYVEIGFLCRSSAVGVHTNQQRSRYLRLYTSLILFSCAKLLASIAAEVKIVLANYLCMEKFLFHFLISVNNPFFFIFQF